MRAEFPLGHFYPLKQQKSKYAKRIIVWKNLQNQQAGHILYEAGLFTEYFINLPLILQTSIKKGETRGREMEDLLSLQGLGTHTNSPLDCPMSSYF